MRHLLTSLLVFTLILHGGAQDAKLVSSRLPSYLVAQQAEYGSMIAPGPRYFVHGKRIVVDMWSYETKSPVHFESILTRTEQRSIHEKYTLLLKSPPNPLLPKDRINNAISFVATPNPNEANAIQVFESAFSGEVKSKEIEALLEVFAAISERIAKVSKPKTGYWKPQQPFPSIAELDKARPSQGEIDYEAVEREEAETK